jgi:GDP-4-dehydro-6-deoxy-D-mannose reductase
VRILITGASGFAGQHLLRYLATVQPAAEWHGTIFNADAAALVPGVIYHRLDLCETEKVQHLIHDIRPDEIYHLAAQSAPSRSLKSPWYTLETNIRTQLNLLQSCLETKLSPRVILVTSSEVYGVVTPEELPITENHPLRPANHYSLSKITQDLMGWQYYMAHKLPVIRVRAFNHIGTGQSADFVATDFAQQIARIEQGQQPPVMRVGNLNARRDFTDVRDTVRAYHLLMQYGLPGESYNVASGTPHSIQELLDILLSYSITPIQIEPDPNRMRPADIPILQGDYSKLKNLTGWQPAIPFRDTLLNVLNDFRHRVTESLRS